jgi:hypothetical protein
VIFYYSAEISARTTIVELATHGQEAADLRTCSEEAQSKTGKKGGAAPEQIS